MANFRDDGHLQLCRFFEEWVPLPTDRRRWVTWTTIPMSASSVYCFGFRTGLTILGFVTFSHPRLKHWYCLTIAVPRYLKSFLFSICKASPGQLTSRVYVFVLSLRYYDLWKTLTTNVTWMHVNLRIIDYIFFNKTAQLANFFFPSPTSKLASLTTVKLAGKKWRVEKGLLLQKLGTLYIYVIENFRSGNEWYV